MKQQLIAQGLTPKEAQIFTTLVRYGSSRASTLCARVNINRTLVYALLESLLKKGFIEKISQNGKTFYIANDPQIFVRNAQKRLSQAKVLLDDLHNIQLIKAQPIIRTFQGLEGILEMTDIFLEEAKQAGGDMLQMGQEIQFVLQYPDLIENFIKKRFELGVPLKLLCNKFEGFNKYLNAERDPIEMREVRLVEREELDVDCTTYLYGDSMAVMSFADEMQGYILKSKNISDLNRKMFFLIWERI